MLYDQRWFRLDIQSCKSGDYLFWNDQGEATLYVDGVSFGTRMLALETLEIDEHGLFVGPGR